MAVGQKLYWSMFWALNTVGGVVAPGLGLEAAPFERESMRVLPQLGRQRQVRFGASAPPAARVTGAAAVSDAARLDFPGRPIVGGVAALHLMRRRRAAE